MAFVHAFKAIDNYMILDVNSGTVFSVDKLIFDIITKYKKMDTTEIVNHLKELYCENDIYEGIKEIEQLESEGLLFTENDYGKLVDNLQARKPVIKAMCLHVAHDCNLRCQYCFASTGNFHGERLLMTEEIGKNALDFLIAHSGNRRNLEVDFFGGEPLMNFDVVKKIVEYGRLLEKKTGKLFKFTITTNGLNLDDEIIAYLNKEMDNVVISIDGRADIHNRMRKTVNGKNSFEIIYPKALKFVQSREQKRYYVRGTFTRNNLDFSNDVVELSNLGFKEISIEPVVSDPCEMYSIGEKDLPVILEEYEKLARIYLARKKEQKEFNFFHFMIDLSQGPCVMKRLTGCGAGNEYVAVTPEGDIYPCHQFVGKTEFIMGNVISGEFDECLQNTFKSNHVLSKNKCNECWAKFYCSGGCPANAYQFNGSIGEPYELGCEMERKRLECALSIYAIERENQ